MKEIISFADAKGHTFQSIENLTNDKVAIHLSEDKVIVLFAEATMPGGRDAQIYELLDTEVLSDWDKVKLGLITQKEYQDILANEDSIRERLNEAKERAEYLRLKAKYEEETA